MGLEDGTREKSVSLVPWGEWAMGTTTIEVRRKKIPWVLGKMFESSFPHASGREEG
jgi:hypothetical protein